MPTGRRGLAARLGNLKMDDRRCRSCGAPLARRSGEQLKDWEARRSCNRSCHVSWKNAEAPWLRFARFAEPVESGCIEWQGNRDADGYGRLETFGEVLAHRIAYMMQNGSIPEGMVICHRCDNPPCVNPAHLFLGSHQDNADDCVSKGRRPSVWGDQNPNFRHGKYAREEPNG